MCGARPAAPSERRSAAVRRRPTGGGKASGRAGGWAGGCAWVVSRSQRRRVRSVCGACAGFGGLTSGAAFGASPLLLRAHAPARAPQIGDHAPRGSASLRSRRALSRRRRALALLRCRRRAAAGAAPPLEHRRRRRRRRALALLRCRRAAAGAAAPLERRRRRRRWQVLPSGLRPRRHGPPDGALPHLSLSARLPGALRRTPRAAHPPHTFRRPPPASPRTTAAAQGG